MKKVIFMAIMMMVAVTTNAQNAKGAVTVQPKVGMNLANFTVDNCDTKVGLIAGAELEYGLESNMGLAVGLVYSMEGFKNNDIKYHLDYINIPVVFNYYAAKGLALKAGLQPGFNVRHKATNGDQTVDINSVASIFGSKVNTFNLAIPVGLSYEYENFVFDARYHISLIKTFKNADKGYNSTFSLTVGYKFDLAQATTKKKTTKTTTTRRRR